MNLEQFLNGISMCEFTKVNAPRNRQSVFGTPVGLPIGIPVNEFGIPLGCVPAPIGIPIPHPSLFAPCREQERANNWARERAFREEAERAARVASVKRAEAERAARWELEIERTTPLKMEVIEDRGSQLIETNKRLSPNELDFHMNRFNAMRAEKAHKDALEARFAPQTCTCGCVIVEDECEEDFFNEMPMSLHYRRF